MFETNTSIFTYTVDQYLPKIAKGTDNTTAERLRSAVPYKGYALDDCSVPFSESTIPAALNVSPPGDRRPSIGDHHRGKYISKGAELMSVDPSMS